MGMIPIVNLMGQKTNFEPKNIDPYKFFGEDSAKVKYDLIYQIGEIADTSFIDMTVKKMGGSWKLDAEQFFGAAKKIKKQSEKPKEIIKDNEDDYKISMSYLQNESHRVSKVIHQKYEDNKSEIPLDTATYFLFIEKKIYKIQLGKIIKVWQIVKEGMADELEINITREKDEFDILGDITFRPQHGRAIVYECNQVPISEMHLDGRYYKNN